jgi:hypothetical protein
VNSGSAGFRIGHGDELPSFSTVNRVRGYPLSEQQFQIQKMPTIRHGMGNT